MTKCVHNFLLWESLFLKINLSCNLIPIRSNEVLGKHKNDDVCIVDGIYDNILKLITTLYALKVNPAVNTSILLDFFNNRVYYILILSFIRYEDSCHEFPSCSLILLKCFILYMLTCDLFEKVLAHYHEEVACVF